MAAATQAWGQALGGGDPEKVLPLYADDAVRLLRTRGFDARRLDVGYPEWQRAGLPVETAA